MTGQVHPSIVLGDKVFAQLKALTANNDACECYVQAAQALGHPELEQQFRRIQLVRDRQGYLTFDLNRERHQAYEKMLRFARSNLSAAQYDKFHMCF